MTDFLSQVAQDLERQERHARKPGGRPVSSGAGSRSRKLACGSCGFIARTTLGALERSGYPTCGCGERLELADFADRVKVGDADALAAADAQAGAELERIDRAAVRRAEREANHGFRARAVNCAVCGRFKRRPADTCSHCGDVPTQHGSDAGDVASFNRGYGYAR